MTTRSEPSKNSSDSSDNSPPWISPRLSRGAPTGYRAFVVVGSVIGIVALPYGVWSYLLGIAGVAAMARQAVLDKRTAAKRAEARERWRNAN